MKKALLMVLACLMLFTFVSCEKDKSGEVVQNVVDFNETMRAGGNLEGFKYFASSCMDESGVADLSKMEDFSSVVGSFDYLVFPNRESHNFEVGDKSEFVSAITKAEGIFSIANDAESNTETKAAENIVVTYKTVLKEYAGEDEYYHEEKWNVVENSESEEKTYSLSGKMISARNPLNVSGLKVNGKSYKDIAVSYDENGNITSATVGGKSVNLSILNSMNF